ncbi:uncharacterized protein [Procambarus clarkii]|uniref:uncharacterized protein n=1 Tax=Procambarus clarkii TaxID=6728 RepID=UPI00374322CF
MKRNHFGRVFILTVVLSASASVASGERWVWADQRSERQVDPSNRPSSLPPLARTAPAGRSSSLAPSASSLHTIPAALRSSSFSVARDLPLQEPLSFRPLAIDISTLPLETPGYSDSLDGLEHPPPVSSVLRDDLAQDLSAGLQISGSGFGFSKTMKVSELGRGTPSPLRQSRINSKEAVVLSPSISEVPLQASASFRDGVTRGQITFPSPVGVRSFKQQSSGRSVTFPQKVVDVDDTRIRSSRLLSEAKHQRLPNTPSISSATPVSTHKNIQGDLPLLRVGSVEGTNIFKVLEALQKESTHVSNKAFNPSIFQRQKQIANDNTVLSSSSDPFILSKQIESLNPSADQNPINAVNPPQLGGLLTSADSSVIFPVKISLPKADLLPRSSSLETATTFKLDKSTLARKPELSKFKSFALFFKKPLGLKKERRASPHAWVWPDKTTNIRFPDLSSERSTLSV